MIDLQEEVRAARRLKLRTGIVKCLAKNWRYLDQVRDYFSWPTDEEFNAAVKELAEEGVITHTDGRLGGVKIALQEKQNG